ncbi:MAG: Maf family protein [Candidatus Bipolaricaulota bacterium]|nr:Maf family protein [Candidatus Bipolaricaulota bacterium]MDW8127037.1 Maf family protein [Candidatus Bipolaricaulota bacterium]
MTKDYTPPIILASSSPRRQELLRLLIPEFLVVPPKVEEWEVQRPEDLLALAEAKALAVAQCHPQALIIAADTAVFRDGQFFGKPRDLMEAKAFLSALSGGWHSVFTGLVVWKEAVRHARLVETRVLFRRLLREEIDWYIQCEDVLDKAGAYAIQGRAAAFVERIEGDFYNVMGLPLSVLWQILWELGWRPKPG